jgi:hypothetical protein
MVSWPGLLVSQIYLGWYNISQSWYLKKYHIIRHYINIFKISCLTCIMFCRGEKKKWLNQEKKPWKIRELIENKK